MVVHKHNWILSLIESKSPLICTSIMGSNILSGQRVTSHQVSDSYVFVTSINYTLMWLPEQLFTVQA